MPETPWTKGDAVVHSLKPEWGHGEVLVATPGTHDGRPCQRLTVRFSRGGTRTVSTAFADLMPAAHAPRLREIAPPPEPEPGTRSESPVDTTLDPLAKAANDAQVAELMSTLPEPATDPFASPKARLAATLALYRFTESGSSLLDWAAAQTGLKDPLSRFNRHELEQWFGRFRIELDDHLRKLVRDLRRTDAAALAQAAAAAGPAAKQALRRAETGR